MLVTHHGRGSWSGTRIGLITAGDDAQGVNATLRAVVRMGVYFGCTVIFIREGFKGLIDGQAENFVEATWNSTSDTMGEAGTFIKRLLTYV
ncbi:ATP-dependent 6-phosphofructokinase [Plakobranchus ocellatus]|uniref:6-phosphofructokinase n=1 Tax=Plakobranchus ocellatus TaxID=259542 RepID=A0AAV3ZK40_9GAST|nr:ATP-dependent 6-phosphofructokinase [Plakobranchus ocellatus]